MAERCLTKASDLSGLLLLYSATANRAGMRRLAGLAAAGEKFNIQFTALFLLQDVDACLDLLVAAGRAPEAAFFARSYVPSRMEET